MSNFRQEQNETIVAISTPVGQGAIGILRVSGKDAIKICSHVVFTKKGLPFPLAKLHANSMQFCITGEKDELLDESMVAVFREPHSYSGEDTVEFYCHGSVYILRKLLSLILKNGARLANQGEFTFRAYLNGKLDLAQADAIADLIASNSEMTHRIAFSQMRGGYSEDLKSLRQELIDFAALIELELDFSEEDVTFANRTELIHKLEHAQGIISRLVHSFEIGNVIKNGIPIAIVGKPNSGKSTLLNALFNEDRAIVSEIAGTTRDTIEEELILNGIKFRFIDTAGLRDTVDVVESLGVDRTIQKIKTASAVLYLFDVHEFTPSELALNIASIHEHMDSINTKLIVVGNKVDKENSHQIENEFKDFSEPILFISAKNKTNLDSIISKLTTSFEMQLSGAGDTIVTNVRHAEALTKAGVALQNVKAGIATNISGELLSADLRNALYHVGCITGEVSTEDLLGSIFGRFCIGK